MNHPPKRIPPVSFHEYKLPGKYIYVAKRRGPRVLWGWDYPREGALARGFDWKTPKIYKPVISSRETPVPTILWTPGKKYGAEAAGRLFSLAAHARWEEKLRPWSEKLYRQAAGIFSRPCSRISTAGGGGWNGKGSVEESTAIRSCPSILRPVVLVTRFRAVTSPANPENSMLLQHRGEYKFRSERSNLLDRERMIFDGGWMISPGVQIIRFNDVSSLIYL